MKKYYVVSIEGHDQLSKIFRFRLAAILYYNKMTRSGFEVELKCQDWSLSHNAFVERSTKWGKG